MLLLLLVMTATVAAASRVATTTRRLVHVRNSDLVLDHSHRLHHARSFDLLALEILLEFLFFNQQKCDVNM